MKIPQFMPYLDDSEYREIKDCFDLNWITEGPKAKVFMESLLELTGASYGVFAPNGTLAIYLALIASGLKPGDEVIVPDFTFLGSASAVVMAGGVPRFCDVNKNNFQIDLTSAEELITENTKFIMPVHIYGTCCEMSEVMAFSKKFNLNVIEDAAQAIGVRYNGQHAGTFGKVGTFSFFADKTITTGEGGFIVTNDEKIYENLLYLRNQGRLDRGSFVHPKIGYNFRITDIQAAVGIVQMRKLDEIMERKSHIWNMYQKNLNDLKDIKFFQPCVNANFIPFRVAVLSNKKEVLDQAFKDEFIETRSFFYPLRKQPCFADFKIDCDKNFNSDFAYKNGICLPSFVGIEDWQILKICETIKKTL